MKSLKTVMLINALSSGATGILLILFPGYLKNLFEATMSWPFVAVGIFLLLFSLLVFIESRQELIRKGRVQFIIVLDILWVMESLCILFPEMFGLSFIGYVLIGGVAVWVAAMALLQWKGLKRVGV